jgi:hypothetical protein
MDNIKELQNLLDQVAGIVKHYDNLALESGEKFNVFDIIGLRNDEVRMHSALLANLLDAQGSHGMKGKFLDIFIKTIEDKKSLDEDNDFNNPFNDLSVTNCISELYAGPKTEDDGGRIDLYIYDSNNKALIIENKIYAPEQYKQLIRYNNFNKDAPILFLTLYGDEPSSSIDEITKKDISKSVYCISYKTDILKWLESCQEEVPDKPLIREGIKHYINLIKILTNQTMDMESKIQIRKIIDKNISLLSSMQESNYNLIGESNFDILLKFIFDLTKELNIDIYKEEFFIPNNFGNKNSKLTLFKMNSNSEIYLWFHSKFNAENKSELWLYISQPKSELKNTKEKLKEYKKNKDVLENEIGIPFKFYNDRDWDQLTERKNIIDAADFIRNLKN